MPVARSSQRRSSGPIGREPIRDDVSLTLKISRLICAGYSSSVSGRPSSIASATRPIWTTSIFSSKTARVLAGEAMRNCSHSFLRGRFIRIIAAPSP